MQEIVGNNILILGYGREGQSVHQYLLKNYSDLKIAVADQKQNLKVPHKTLAFLGNGYLSYLSDFDTVIRSPGIPFATKELQFAIKNGVHVTSSTNIFFAAFPGQVIGVTGTKGKSTTASLITQILKTKYPDVKLAGNIGKPILEYLNEITEKTLFVFELSSHQLEDCHYSPYLAVILNIFPEHLDYYADIDCYYQAKTQIVKFQNPNDQVVFDAQNDISLKLANLSRGIKHPVYSNLETLKQLIPLKELSLLGDGNYKNIAMAMAVGRIFNINNSQIHQALKNFQPLPHRLEFIGNINGIKFYNDSLATVPEATIHALNALGNDVQTLIVGGFDRGLDFSKLAKTINEHSGLKNLILFPTTGEKIFAEIIKLNPQNLTRFQKLAANSMPEAVALAFKNTSQNKICLLSPACASFNLFKDYADRGDQFRKAVKQQRANLS